MNIQNQTKKATAFAKDGDYCQAIIILKKLIPVMAESGGFSASSYYKIIPYFQKAGRTKSRLTLLKK